MRKTIDKKHYGLAAFIDLKKVFDTVDHNLLIKKLNSFGLRGQIENLLRDYHMTENNSYFRVIKSLHRGALIVEFHKVQSLAHFCF